MFSRKRCVVLRPGFKYYFTSKIGDQIRHIFMPIKKESLSETNMLILGLLIKQKWVGAK
jgi:hypothetical protein